MMLLQDIRLKSKTEDAFKAFLQNLKRSKHGRIFANIFIGPLFDHLSLGMQTV